MVDIFSSSTEQFELLPVASFSEIFSFVGESMRRFQSQKSDSFVADDLPARLQVIEEGSVRCGLF